MYQGTCFTVCVLGIVSQSVHFLRNVASSDFTAYILLALCTEHHTAVECDRMLYAIMRHSLYSDRKLYFTVNAAQFAWL